jgi:5-amino-6-(5-phosphoribosylamino)uracil reductase
VFELQGITVIVGGFMSVDGKIAPANRNGREFTHFMTPEHTKILHEIRSSVDAVIVGVDTVIADDPSLTVRAVQGKNPLRIVLDSNARTPLNSKILNINEAPTLIVVSKNAPQERIAALKSKNVEVLASSAERSKALQELMDALKPRGVKRVLVEGGAEVRWSFFERKLVDELFVWVMPYIWGGRDAPTLVGGSGFLNAECAVPLKVKSMEQVEGILILWFSVGA